MINKKSIRHKFLENKDMDILNAIIHFLMVSDEEWRESKKFMVPSLISMLEVLDKHGYNGMANYVEELYSRLNIQRPWVNSPKEFFSSNSVVAQLCYIKNNHIDV